MGTNTIYNKLIYLNGNGAEYDKYSQYKLFEWKNEILEDKNLRLEQVQKIIFESFMLQSDVEYYLWIQRYKTKTQDNWFRQKYKTQYNDALQQIQIMGTTYTFQLKNQISEDTFTVTKEGDLYCVQLFHLNYFQQLCNSDPYRIPID